MLLRCTPRSSSLSRPWSLTFPSAPHHHHHHHHHNHHHHHHPASNSSSSSSPFQSRSFASPTISFAASASITSAMLLLLNGTTTTTTTTASMRGKSASLLASSTASSRTLLPVRTMSTSSGGAPPTEHDEKLGGGGETASSSSRKKSKSGTTQGTTKSSSTTKDESFSSFIDPETLKSIDPNMDYATMVNHLKSLGITNTDLAKFMAAAQGEISDDPNTLFGDSTTTTTTTTTTGDGEDGEDGKDIDDNDFDLKDIDDEFEDIMKDPLLRRGDPDDEIDKLKSATSAVLSAKTDAEMVLAENLIERFQFNSNQHRNLEEEIEQERLDNLPRTPEEIRQDRRNQRAHERAEERARALDQKIPKRLPEKLREARLKQKQMLQEIDQKAEAKPTFPELEEVLEDAKWTEFQNILMSKKPKRDTPEAYEEMTRSLKKHANIPDPDINASDMNDQEYEERLPKHSDPKVEVLITRIDQLANSAHQFDDFAMQKVFDILRTLISQYAGALGNVDVLRVLVDLRMCAGGWWDCNKSNPPQTKGVDFHDAAISVKNAVTDKGLQLNELCLGTIFQIAVLTLDRQSFETLYSKSDIERLSFINDPESDTDIAEALQKLYPTPADNEAQKKPPAVRPSRHGIQVSPENNAPLEKQLHKFDMLCQSFDIAKYLPGNPSPLDDARTMFFPPSETPLSTVTAFTRVFLALVDLAGRIDTRYEVEGKYSLGKRSVGKLAMELNEYMTKQGIQHTQTSHAALVWALTAAEVPQEQLEAVFQSIEQPNSDACNAVMEHTPEPTDALTLYNYMQRSENPEIRPNLKTFQIVLSKFMVSSADPADLTEEEFKELKLGKSITQAELARVYEEDRSLLRKAVLRIYRDLKRSGLRPNLEIFQALCFTLVPQYKSNKELRLAAKLFSEQFQRDFPNVDGLHEFMTPNLNF